MTEAHPQSAPFARRERPGWVAIAFIGMCVLTAVSLYVGGVHMVHKPSLRPAIAVLPFTTVNADDDAQRFGVKIAAELTGALRNAVELRVTDQAPDVQVMGSVEGADGHVLVTVRLIRKANRYQLWSHTYEEDPQSDSAVLAKTMAIAVRAALHTRAGR